MMTLAAAYNRLNIIKMLVQEFDANTEQMDDWVCFVRVFSLTKYSHSINQGDTPLMTAAYSNNLSIIKYLIEECHVDLNVKCPNVCKIFIHFSLIRLALYCHTQTDIQSDRRYHNKTALEIAQYENCSSIISYLTEYSSYMLTAYKQKHLPLFFFISKVFVRVNLQEKRVFHS